jgi:hypothetical protein
MTGIIYNIGAEKTSVFWGGWRFGLDLEPFRLLYCTALGQLAGLQACKLTSREKEIEEHELRICTGDPAAQNHP